MTRRALILLTLALGACSGSKQPEQANSRILAISFWENPNPPTKNRVRGSGDYRQLQPENTPESQISEAFLHCGVKQLAWTALATDGGSRLITPDNEKSRAAVKCVAKIFPMDFYVKPETASKSDLAALAKTPR